MFYIPHSTVVLYPLSQQRPPIHTYILHSFSKHDESQSLSLHLLPPERAALGESGLAAGRLAEDLRATCFVKVRRKTQKERTTKGTQEKKKYATTSEGGEQERERV